MNSQRVLAAIEWATELHGGQKRKGTELPYIFHPMQVATLVADHGGTESEVIGAVLHDTIEDAGGAPLRAEIERRFGSEVAAIVDACSDARDTPKPPWRERKEAFIHSLSDTDNSTRLVVAADKIHNATCTVRDLQARGASVWSLFRGGRDGTLWYYDSVLAALEAEWSHPILRELRTKIAELHEVADVETSRDEG